MKTVNALRDCNLLVFCGYPRDMADMPMQRRSHGMFYRKSIQFVSALMSERRVLRIGVPTFTGTQECFVGRCFCAD